MEAHTLLEVNQYIKRVLALNFQEAFWVECEISQASHSRGNVYLQLIQKAENSDEIIAQNSANIWYKQYLFLKRKLGKLVDSILKDGIKVKLKVNINYSERYGLSLGVEDIDPSYTFGQFELNRQKTIEQLKQKELIDRNAQQPLPSVIQKIAIISSATAAGYQDFRQQLIENPYGYQFQLDLYQSAMQGQKTESDVVGALREARKGGYDIITIIRGGGSKLDLSAFDHYNIAFEIAASDTPVWTGIGHDIDMTVADIVAHTVLKTPTAVADSIIEHNAHFEGQLLGIEEAIKQEVSALLQDHHATLLLTQERLQAIPKALLSSHTQLLHSIDELLLQTATQKIETEKLKLKNIDEKIAILDPKNVLDRGYTLIRQASKYLPNKKALNKKATDLEIIFNDGSLPVKIDL